MQPALPPHLEQLAALLERVPAHRPKVLFVPKPQVGRAALTALAASGRPWLNLQATTVARHAAVRAAAILRAGRWRPLAPGAAVLLVDALLRARPDGAACLTDAAGGGVGRSLLATLQALRLAEIPPAACRETAETARARAVAVLYARYVETLETARLADEAQVYRLALETPADPAPCTCALFDEVELTALSRRYLERLADESGDCYRVTHTGPVPAPRQSAAALLADDPRWRPLAPHPCAAPQPERLFLAEAVGAENEVRAVVRYLLERGLPLDRVEVAYTANDPYLTLLHAAAERHGIPHTLAAGLPARATPSGQALRGFLRWIEEGLEAATLVRLLRGGLVQTERSCRIASHRVAALLAESDAGRGRATYTRAFRALVRAAAGDAPRQEQVERAAAAVERLLRLVPVAAEVPVAQLAAAGMAFLRLFGPTGLPPEKRPSDYTLDEHALSVLLQRLRTLGEQLQVEAPLPLLARRLRELVEATFAGARAPQPGRLHIVPLTSAGYAGRPHLFVVGMDEATFRTPLAEDPLLLDDERRRLARPDAAPLPLGREQVSGGAYHFERALAGATGSATLLANRLDLEHDRPLDRSIPFLQWQEATGRPVERHTFVPAPPGTCGAWTLDRGAVDDVEAWLYARASAPSGLEPRLRSRYPAAAQGRHAAAERARPVLTRYDGWLGEALAGHVHLDPFSRKVSASRLETLAACPHRYFLRYVLNVAPLQQQAQDEGACLDPMERGGLLHAVLEAFLRERKERGDRPGTAHRAELHALLDRQLEAKFGVRLEERPVAADGLRRTLRAALDAFLRAEEAAGPAAQPHAFELGFGLNEGEGRNDDDHEGELVLRLGDDLEVRVRGWIDRVDRLPDGTLALWDYKTGSSRRYETDDLFDKGKNLQWALYSYALETLFPGRKIARAGYYFLGAGSAGVRVHDDPGRVRTEATETLRRLAGMARAGVFPPAPDASTCRYCDYTRVCGSYQKRKTEIDDLLILHPDDAPYAVHLQEWNYPKPWHRKARDKR